MVTYLNLASNLHILFRFQTTMFGPMAETGARDGIWTHDNLLGKQTFYRWITLAIKEQIKTFRNQQCSLFVNLFYNAQKNEQFQKMNKPHQPNKKPRLSPGPSFLIRWFDRSANDKVAPARTCSGSRGFRLYCSDCHHWFKFLFKSSTQGMYYRSGKNARTILENLENVIISLSFSSLSEAIL